MSAERIADVVGVSKAALYRHLAAIEKGTAQWQPPRSHR
jgi:hypothetical protein